MKTQKIVKICLWVLLLLSLVLIVWAFASGFSGNDYQSIDLILYWAYVLIGITLVAWVIVGGVIAIANNPKSLVKGLMALVAVAVVCLIAYLIAPGDAIPGRELDASGTLKLTDTVLYLIYLLAGITILSIIVGEIRVLISNKKK